MNIPELLVRDLLERGGMLGPFTDPRGNVQPAPKTQIYEFREHLLDESRGIFIRKTGDASINPYLVEEPIVTIGFVSLPEDNDMPIARNRIQEIFEYLLNNFQECSMHGSTPSSPLGPYKLASGRYSCEINLSVSIGRASV